MNTLVQQPSEDSTYRDIDAFLGEVERRALVMAEMATRSRDDALDLVQDAMLAFVRRYADRPQREWAPLFHRILQNRIRDWARRRKVRSRWMSWLQSDDDNDADPIQQLDDPAARPIEQRLDQNRAGEQLCDAVAALPLRQQQAFMLRIWEGLDVASTARAMGCSDGSVKTHLSRALKSLRARLEEYEP
jgi:RNA polymerase sigma-70 factor (ECF subfamily)